MGRWLVLVNLNLNLCGFLHTPAPVLRWNDRVFEGFLVLHVFSGRGIGEKGGKE